MCFCSRNAACLRVMHVLNIFTVLWLVLWVNRGRGTLSTGYNGCQVDETIGPFLNQVELIHSGTRASRTIPRIPQLCLPDGDNRISVVYSELVAREKPGICIEVDEGLDE